MADVDDVLLTQEIERHLQKCGSLSKSELQDGLQDNIFSLFT